MPPNVMARLEEASKPKKMKKEDLKATIEASKQGQKQLEKNQAKKEEATVGEALENLDKSQLLQLIQSQMALAQKVETAGTLEEEEEEDDGGESEAINIFNTLFEQLEETREQTQAMKHMFDGMNCMANTLLASARAQEKQPEAPPTLIQAHKQRMQVGESLLEKFGKEQQKAEEDLRGKQLLAILTESLAPMIQQKTVEAAASQKQPAPKSTAKNQPGQSTASSATKKNSISEKRKRLQDYLARHKQ